MHHGVPSEFCTLKKQTSDSSILSIIFVVSELSIFKNVSNWNELNQTLKITNMEKMIGISVNNWAYRKIIRTIERQNRKIDSSIETSLQHLSIHHLALLGFTVNNKK